MGWWTDVATKKTGCPNVGGRMSQQRGVVLHIAQGSYNGTISWQMNPASEVSSHFIVAKSGACTQMVDTDYTAWTQADGNGKWLSIEFEGYVPDQLTDAQVEKAAQILSKANAVYGCPIQVATCPDDKGLGHHSMGAECPQCGEYWGHSECPGSSIKSQKQRIVDIASGEEMPSADEIAQAVWSKSYSDPVYSGKNVSCATALMRSYKGGENASTLLGTTLGASGPTVGVAVQSTYQMVSAMNAVNASLQSTDALTRRLSVLVLLDTILTGLLAVGTLTVLTRRR